MLGANSAIGRVGAGLFQQVFNAFVNPIWLTACAVSSKDLSLPVRLAFDLNLLTLDNLERVLG